MGYIQNTEKQIKEMLKFLGFESPEEIWADIPKVFRFPEGLSFPPPLSEIELREEFQKISSLNKTVKEYSCFLGGGAYYHFIPSVVNHIISRSEFYTAYTPYQPEASQGTLQTIFEFQTMICELCGMEIANASLYDGATSLAEAVFMALDLTKRREILISETVHPEYRQVLKTYLKSSNFKIIEIESKEGVSALEEFERKASCETACIIFQNPNFFGLLEEVDFLVELSRKVGAISIFVLISPISLGILKSPGEYGVDIVAGEAQSLGNPLSFGGPHVGFLASKEKYLRRMPGRLVGQTFDKNGKRGFVLTLQTREQHIKREKATSNICSNQALCALATTVYLAYLGKKGIKEVANLCLQKAHYAYDQMQKIKKIEIPWKGQFFNEFVIKFQRKDLDKALLDFKILGAFALFKFYPELENYYLFCFTEMNHKNQIDYLIEVLGKI